MFRSIAAVERSYFMTRQKCSSCGNDAFAYLIEADGSRIYLCLEHFPGRDAPRFGEQQKTPNDSGEPQP